MRYTMVIDDAEHIHLVKAAEKRGITVPELLYKVLNGQLTFSPSRMQQDTVLITEETDRSGAAGHHAEG